jgi:carboxyl-terminal processing protease
MKTRLFIVLWLVVLGFSAIAVELGGIGILLVDKRKGDEPYRIEKVYPGSPAERAGIKAEWFLISIDGTNVVSMPLAQSVSMLRGPVGAKVTLELADPAMSRTNKFTLRRARMVLGKAKVEFLDE